jgi:hypothetical protein
MSEATTGLRWALLALLCGSVAALAGCSHGSSGLEQTRSLPTDLPCNPDPTKKYCKVWVEPVYRKVPKVVMAAAPSTTKEEVLINRTTAYEVQTKPAEVRRGQTCGTDCDDNLVMVKPGGYRWEHDGTCWQYKYRCPEYKWCKKKVQEDGIKYCYEIPAEYETVAKTEQVTELRDRYVPAQYKTVWVDEVFEPGHWEWRAHDAAGCTPDRREWRGPTNVGRTCAPRAKARALDCGCPTTN